MREKFCKQYYVSAEFDLLQEDGAVLYHFLTFCKDS